MFNEKGKLILQRNQKDVFKVVKMVFFSSTLSLGARGYNH